MLDHNQLSWVVDSETRLRLLNEKDAAELFALTHRNRKYLRRWLCWVDEIESPVHTLRYIHSSLRQCREDRGFQVGIWFRSNLVGVIGYQNLDWSNQAATLGYWLDASYQGRGLVSRSAGVLLDWAFEEWRLNRVEIRCARENYRSRAIPERLGFTKEGIKRQGEWLYDHFVDLVIYAMLVSEWRTARSKLHLTRPA